MRIRTGTGRTGPSPAAKAGRSPQKSKDHDQNFKLQSRHFHQKPFPYSNRPHTPTPSSVPHENQRLTPRRLTPPRNEPDANYTTMSSDPSKDPNDHPNSKKLHIVGRPLDQPSSDQKPADREGAKPQLSSDDFQRNFPEAGGSSLSEAVKTIKPEDFLEVHKSACGRQGLMSGIVAGAVVGGLRFVWRGTFSFPRAPSLRSSSSRAVGDAKEEKLTQPQVPPSRPPTGLSAASWRARRPDSSGATTCGASSAYR